MTAGPGLRVAVLGTGPIGLGSAALLASLGHRPVLWSPRPHPTATATATAASELRAEGALQYAGALTLAADCAAAVTGADAVLVAVPATAYRTVPDQLAAVLRPDQPVLISGHLSFGAPYLAQRLAERGIAVPIAAWGTTVVSGRRTAPGQVRVSSIRTEVDLAALPPDAAQPMLALCRRLFGDRFRTRAGLLAVALSNVNPQNHLAIALCNFTRIERGETWFQNTNITDIGGPADGGAGCGAPGHRGGVQRLAVRTLRQHFHHSFHVPEAPLGEMARVLTPRPATTPAAPTSLDTRYVLEDAPFGLYPTVLLGRLCGRPCPAARGRAADPVGAVWPRSCTTIMTSCAELRFRRAVRRQWLRRLCGERLDQAMRTATGPG